MPQLTWLRDPDAGRAYPRVPRLIQSAYFRTPRPNSR